MLFMIKMDNTYSNKSNIHCSKLISNKTGKVNLAPPPFSDHYDMGNSNGGIAMIFNYMNFENDYCPKRYGSDVDRDSLADVFKELNFNVQHFDDLSEDETRKALFNASKMDYSHFDCLVVIVMTHGDQNILCASDDSYPTNLLWSCFSANNCPTLAGKPKLFFIQACRGKKMHEGFRVPYVKEEIDSTSKHAYYSIPIMADILVMYATIEGFYAWRTDTGSVFIQSLIHQLRKHSSEKDLLTILTFVNREVAIDFTLCGQDSSNEYYETKQMCSIVSTLTRLLFFRSKELISKK